jgi:peptidoglycan/LPS O-acetylase OafA/YrhL
LKYRADIDGLRALAIVSVVAYHIGLPFATGGYAGVDVFFVVSGFLITRLLVGELQRTGTVSLPAFYERRARRLLPALSLVVLATLVCGFFLLPFPFAHRDLGNSAIYTLVFAANRFFRIFAGGYFQDSVALMPLAHTWSLGVEEQFYLFYPFAILLFFRFVRVSPWKRLNSAIAAGTVASFVLSAVLVAIAPTRAFFWAPSRAWELGVGALVALNLRDETVPRPMVGMLLGTAGLAAIAAAFVFLAPASPFPGALALAPVIGSAMIIAAVPLAPQSILARALSNRALTALGRVSYSWYLWHWPILAIARRWRLGDENIGADAAWALLALGLAVLTTRFIERPFRRRVTEPRAPRRRFAALATITTLLLIGLSITMANADVLWPARVPQLEAVVPPAPCRFSRGEHGLAFGTCAVQPPHHPSAIAMWGDSHAEFWAPAIWSLGDAQNVTAFVLTKSACPPLLGVTLNRPGVRDNNCARDNQAVKEWLSSKAVAQHEGAMQDVVRGVILSARWPHYVQGGLDPQHYSLFVDSREAAPWSSPEIVRAGLERTLAFTDSIGLRVLILLTPPEFRYRLPECILVRGSSRCGISRAEADSYRLMAERLVRTVARTHPNVRVMETFDFFCDSLYCPALTHGVMATRDASHVSAAAARAFAPLMREDFLWLVGGGTRP